MNRSTVAAPTPASLPGNCARCGEAQIAEGLFCPSCGLPAGFVPVVVEPRPPAGWQRRSLGIIAGILSFLAAVAGVVLVLLGIAYASMSIRPDDEDGDLRAVAVSADGRLAVAVSRLGRVAIWDVATGYPIRTIETKDRGVAAFSPDGWLLATGDRADCAVNLWSAQTGERVRRLTPAAERSGRSTGTLAVAFAASGGMIAAGCQDGSVTVWNADAGTALVTVEAHKGEVRAVAFAPDAGALYSGGADRAIHRWTMPGGQAAGDYSGLKDGVASLAPTPDGNRLIGATDGVRGDQRIIVWDVKTRSEVSRLGWDKGMAPVALSPDGSLLATSTLGRIDIVERSSGEVARDLDLPGSGGSIEAVAFSRDGRWLVAVGDDGLAGVWDPANGALIRRLRW